MPAPAAAAAAPDLVCPVDGRPLAARGGTVACADGHAFAVRGGIPRIVASERTYADAFGEQWNRYRRTQLDSWTGTTISRDRLRRCLGETLWAQLSAQRPAQVLEAGCGAGRFSEVLLHLPAVRLTSTDLSDAVDANQLNCPQDERHRVVQCDIGAMPFAPGSYDVVICLGVIQHTPSPEAAIARLYAQVRPGGWLAIDHYSPSFAHYTKVTALALRPVLKRLRPASAMKATEALVRVFFPLHRAARRHRLLQILLSRVSPLLTCFHAYPELGDDLQYEWALLDTNDSLTDYYKHFRTRGQIAKILADLGAADVWVETGGNGVEARCRKPA